MTALASALSNEKETILLISHNATRTGAPILAWNICEQLKQRYNVICVLLRGGEIVPFKQTCAYVVGPFEEHLLLCAGATISAIKKRFGIKFAIINSYESKLVLKSIAANAIPSIFLIHEFLNDSHLEDFYLKLK
ncbi:MAG: hypothetical protein HWD59_09550 [Coxiellaceae bacterium]|nr:MAG: hypothetical protein HWD59_09550 [Coxiellaceae bacterium]